MWPGEQQPGGGQSQQPNPYHQPGYRQSAPWNAPTGPGNTPQAPQGSGGGDGNRTKVIAIVAAAAVVVAAGVTGFLVLGGDKDDDAKPGPTPSSASKSPSPAGSKDTERGVGGGPKPTIAGWTTAVNTERGIAFDAPPQYELRSRDWVTARGEADDPDSLLIGMGGSAVLKKQWCRSDSDRDGVKDDTPLAEAGSRGNRDAKSTEQIAKENSAMWVYGAYSQPDRKNITTSAVEPYTTDSGIKGSLATSSSSGVKSKDKCRTDGKATTFGFRDSKGKLVSWSFFGAKGVSDEVPDATVKKMLSTVREYEDGS
ncbi:hypothetical protein ACFVXC_15135 [Streptomyces sp. NPDC058257]|uniref:hypothetical protein n=1 Tax=Streptomyces sp. NPDC058257 TaxID=3346409 RepID=UPI0036ED2CE5